jgi:hypothetical protein
MVRDVAMVQGSVISVRTEIVVPLGHEIEGGGPWASRRVRLYRPAVWHLTQPWPQPSDQEQGGAGGRLLPYRVLCEYGACYAAPLDGFLLVMSSPGIPLGWC